MWTDITCQKCEKVERLQIYKKDRWKEEGNYTCPECWAKEKNKKDQAIEEALTAGLNLPNLIGSDKQIEWAHKIRLKKIKELTEYIAISKKNLKRECRISKELFDMLNSFLVDIDTILDSTLNNSSAKFWIDNRDNDIKKIVGQTFRINEFNDWIRKEAGPSETEEAIINTQEVFYEIMFKQFN